MFTATHKSLLQPLLVKWSADEQRWLPDNCKVFAALKATDPAPSPASAAPSSASPAPAITDVSPASTTRAQAKKADAANKPPVAAVDTAAESDDLELERPSGARGHGGLARLSTRTRARNRKQHQGRGCGLQLLGQELRTRPVL